MYFESWTKRIVAQTDFYIYDHVVSNVHIHALWPNPHDGYTVGGLLAAYSQSNMCALGLLQGQG